ncbi:restriction endonuclease subunit S [Rossellomorea marisflavi]|uniref:restriction endonuclease subunit S n=1 Tax=Rossellomorea marisflavi TaxID=189381 RepID=UPI0028532663|nr:restriction endonuclease subunit S [Rossellomorea marisflavi]MDR4934896.1 restriction endonuclease subunit S [Rossellomorea marisflavi]
MNAQDLLNSILQLAVQGKLVEHREEEGTAKELLEKIEEEKKKLIKEKVIKRPKNLPEISDDEIQFDIPESWEWTRLETVSYSIGNKSNQIKQSEILQDGKYPVVSQSMNRIEGYSNEGSKLLKVQPLSVIVFGDHSKTIKLIDFDFIIGADGTKIMVPISLNPDYLYYVLSYNVINMRDRGYSRHFQFLKEKLVPLPPLEEQKRIVAKIEELIPYVEKYDKAYSEVEKVNKKFPEDMQKSILQYAIRGKLVEQREEEGTAEELYQQIQEEKKKLVKEGKIRKEKPLQEVTEDDISFEIPESWKWVSIGQVCSNVMYGTSKKSSKEGKIAVLRMGNLQGGKIDYSDLVYSSDDGDIEKYKLDKNDLLFNRTNSRDLVGKTAIYKKELPAIYAGYLVRLTPVKVISDYINYVMQSDYYWRYCQTVRSDAIGQSNINAEKLKRFVFPLPPLEEQKRIVAKIEELLPYNKKLINII